MNLRQRWQLRKQSSHLVHQHDIADCGPSALLTALRILGGNTSLETVRRLAGTDSSGTSVFGLASAARQLGMDASAVKGSFEDLAGQKMPLLAHVVTPQGLGHFLTVLAADAKGVYVADPAGRCRQLERAEFLAQWQSQIAILLTPSPTQPLRREPQPRVEKWLWDNLSVYGTWITQSVFTGCLYAMLAVAAAVVLQMMIDRIIPSNGASLALAGAVGFALVGLVRAAMGYIRQYLGAHFMKTAGSSIARAFVEQIFLRDFNFFRSRRPKDVSSRLSDLVTITNSLVWTLGEIIVDLLTVIAVAAMLSRISGVVTAVTLLSLGVLGASLVKLLGEVARDQRESLGAFVRAESVFLDSVTGISELKTFSLESVHADRVRNAFDRYMDTNHRVRKRAAVVSIFAECAGVCLLAFVLGYSALLVMHGQMKIGTLMETYALLGFALPSVAKLSQSLISAQLARISAERLLENLGAPPEDLGGGMACEQPGELRCQDIQLLRPDGRPLVKAADFVLRRGELVIVEGDNGCGKSTFAQALQLKVRAASGCYSIDEVPVEAYALDCVRRQIAVVGKETHLFSGSLIENILNHVPEAGRAEALARLDTLGINAAINQLGLGAMTQLGEGGRQLSSGENQLIGFARALAGDPAFLVLDEAFSAMDSDRRRWALEVVRSYVRDHGVLVIDHAWKNEITASRSYRIVDQQLAQIRPVAESTLHEHAAYA
jgi:ABC-type bacteriocin/lantibiotic exporter with double-glycine peptidase domain